MKWLQAVESLTRWAYATPLAIKVALYLLGGLLPTMLAGCLLRHRVVSEALNT